ncbi:MAG: deoxyhypusine synthase [Halobacteriaceae archaeon]
MTDEPREEFSADPLDHTRVWAGMTVGDLIEAYGDAGIGAADLHEAATITATMLGEEDTTVLMGVAGAVVPAGMRVLVAELIADGYIDALVTTGAALTHDTIEAIGGHHHHGSAGPHDHRSTETTERSRRDHDEQLREEGVDRIYNVYLPQEHFADFETHLREHVFPTLEGATSIQAFTHALGAANAAANDGVDAHPGIAATAADRGVPIYCPAIQDSVLGLQTWMYAQTTDVTLDALADMTHLNDLVADADQAGALLVGGGVPKNYVLQAMLVTPDAYDYAVQLTTDPESTGGLSGATLDEARSWGKLAPEARNATVVGDATITLPLLVAGARERIEG